MAKNLKIGDEIVIYPKKGHSYESLETKNGYKNQVYDSSNFPETLTAVFIGREEGKDGKWYERYTLKTIPQELLYFSLYGKRGFENLIEELNKISEILQGTAEDGRKILYSRSINIEDVNEILGVVVDYKNKRIYQKNNPSKDINKAANFGKIRKILPFEAEECRAIDSEFIKGNQLEFTAYWYSIWDLKISEKRKEIVELNVKYHLASRSVGVDSGYAYFCKGSVDSGDADMNRGLFNSYGVGFGGWSAVRPVFYLESDIQSEVIEEQQEVEKVLKEVETKKEKDLKEPQEIKAFEYLKEIKKQQKKIEDMQKDIIKQEEEIAKMQEDLNKEEKELEKMLEKALNLV